MDHKRFDRAKHARDTLAYEALGVLFAAGRTDWCPDYMREDIARLRARYEALNTEMDAALVAEVKLPLYDVKVVEAAEAALRG